jgi:hypothetical protein
MRFSGHESFACRYAWLPKAYAALAQDPSALSDEESAMVELGIGKNMVRSLRFWLEVFDITNGAERGRYELTSFAHSVLGPEGHDPYLEDVRTLWLLHWKVATHSDRPLFAWRHLFNHWPHGELTRTEAVAAFERESQRMGLRHSPVTLGQHFDVFIHTYVSSSRSGNAEDSLDGPLVELKLIEWIGERRSGSDGRREPVYGFRREPKPEISRAVFEYCINDYWQQWAPGEATLTFRDLSVAVCSVGRAFLLPEDDIRSRLDVYATQGLGLPFVYTPSAIQGLLSRRKEWAPVDFLDAVYAREAQRA